MAEGGNGNKLARSSLLLNQGSKNMLHERRKSGGFDLDLIKPMIIPRLHTSGVLIIIMRVQEIERKNSKKCS
jgi:hypothetical protein